MDLAVRNGVPIIGLTIRAKRIQEGVHALGGVPRSSAVMHSIQAWCRKSA
jgi:hypothetical protein